MKRCRSAILGVAGVTFHGVEYAKELPFGQGCRTAAISTRVTGFQGVTQVRFHGAMPG